MIRRLVDSLRSAGKSTVVRKLKSPGMKQASLINIRNMEQLNVHGIRFSPHSKYSYFHEKFSEMNLKKLALALLICSTGLVSCQKCMQCSYKTTTTTRTSEEFCGNDGEREVFERQWRTEGTSNGVSTHCVEIKD